MGVLTDFFVADDDEINRVDIQHGPGDLPTLESKGTDTVLLETLDHILTGSSFLYSQPLADAGSDGPWLIAVRDELTHAVARLTSNEVLALAHTVANHEDWLDPEMEAPLAGFLPDLVALAKRAVASEKHLYLWICL